MDWVRHFYSRTGTWWGPAGTRPGAEDHTRVTTLRRHAGPPPARILELGAGYGTTASATARSGYDVTAVDLSDRIDLAPADQPGLTAVKADFYEVRLDGPVTAVTYWDGFGVGTDPDQRRLLTRIARDWLRPDGVALLDVYNPFTWAAHHGAEQERLPRPDAGYPYHLHNRKTFNPSTCVATDTWWQAGHPDEAISQRLRCYTPADLTLLLEGTGLALAAVEASSLRDSWSYLAALRRPL